MKKCLRQVRLLVGRSFKQGACQSKEQWSVKLKGIKDNCKLGVETLKAWISMTIEVKTLTFDV